MKNSRKSSPLNQERAAWYTPREQLEMSDAERQQAYSDNARLLAESMLFTPAFGRLAQFGMKPLQKIWNIISGSRKSRLGVNDDLYSGLRAQRERAAFEAANPSAPVVRSNVQPTAPYTFSPKELQRVQGMNTPLTPNLTPVNPRGLETVKWAGGREVIKPGTPGRGGAPTYSAKDPLWPIFEGTNLDKILYPKNWMGF